MEKGSIPSEDGCLTHSRRHPPNPSSPVQPSPFFVSSCLVKALLPSRRHYLLRLMLLLRKTKYNVKKSPKRLGC